MEKSATVDNMYARSEESFAHWETTKDLIDEMIGLYWNTAMGREGN